MVLAPIRRKWAFNLANAISMGLGSGTVRWEEEEPGAPLLQRALGLFAFMGWQVVEDDDVAGFE